YRYKREKKFDDAINEFKKALEFDPKYLSARADLAEVYAVKDMKSQALAEYKQIMEIDPEYSFSEGDNTDLIKYPTVIKRSLPSYTEAARKEKVTGTTILKARIRKDGTVDNIILVRGIGYDLDESARKTIKTWRFKPATLDGQPVNFIAHVE